MPPQQQAGSLCEIKLTLPLSETSYNWLNEQEKLKESRIEKFLGPSFILETTDKFPGVKSTPPAAKFEFHPSPVRGSAGIILLWPFVGLVLMGVINIFSIVFILCIVGLIIHLIFYWRIVKNSHRKITLSAKGVQFDNGQWLYWSSITLTAILTKPVGRGKRTYLVIVTRADDSSYQRNDYELIDYFSWNPYGFASTLSSKIESIRNSLNSHNSGFAAMAG